jgi:nitrogen regulatory protein PII
MKKLEAIIKPFKLEEVQSAGTNRKDDGKIFVKDLVEVIRIRTEERGERAI